MFKTITPIDNTVYLEREYDSAKIEDAISNSVIAQKEWASLEVNERVELLKKFVSDFLSRKTLRISCRSVVDSSISPC